MKQHLIKSTPLSTIGLTLILAFSAPLQAETITIGKGTGILWEGLPFNETLTGVLYSEILNGAGLLSISNLPSHCLLGTNLKKIGGYWAKPLAGMPGVGLAPRASGSATYTRYNGEQETLTGTIGLPQTKGTSPSGTTGSPPAMAWCLPPSMIADSQFYSSFGPRTATLSGTWVLVADGTQQNGMFKLPSLYFASLSNTDWGHKSVSILPSNISLRISTLECTVNTPTTIEFGGVIRNTQANAELAVKPVPLVTNCGQASDKINANINLQFRAISGLYNSAPSRLALNQGGGYITGEIDNGVTGSGACNATTGLRFDNTAVKLGSITSAQSSQTFTNLLTWRLCSGGSSLPTGPVNASTEMLVTFN